jgi:MFS transporter, ACS family, aldohexuronate transporter
MAADIGSIAGGWMSSTLIARGWTVNRARKTTLLVAAVSIVPTAFAPMAGSLWLAVAMVSVAASAHQWWSANLFTSVSDMFPRGMMTSMAFQRATGTLLDATHGDYRVIFLVCGVMYVAALGIMHVLVPRMEPVVD